MSTQTEEVEGGYRFLAIVLFLFIALPLASYAIFPSNSYVSFLSYPARILLIPIHEFGHVLLIFLTEIFNLPSSSMQIPILVAGSFFEVFLPLFVMLLFIFGNQRYALACLVIVVLGASIYDVGRYVQSSTNPTGPALNSLMQPTTITPETHDWTRILKQFNALDKADFLGGLLSDLGFVVILLGFFSSVFELNLILNNRVSSDFMLLMLYGSIPTLLLSIIYFTPFRITFATLFCILPVRHFYTSTLPKLRKEIEEVDKEIKEVEGAKKEPVTETQVKGYEKERI